MHTPDVIPMTGLPEPKVEPRELTPGPELWPVGLTDAAWIVVGVVLARVLLLLA